MKHLLKFFSRPDTPSFAPHIITPLWKSVLIDLGCLFSFGLWKPTTKSNELLSAWNELLIELNNHQKDLNLSFGMEYSSIVDWVADLTPRRGHPKAREYGKVWIGQGSSPAEAIRKVLIEMRRELDKG